MSNRRDKMLDNSEYLANEYLAEQALLGLSLVKSEKQVQPIPTKPSLWEKIKRLFK